MLLRSSALAKVLVELASPERVSKFVKDSGADCLANLLAAHAVPIGMLLCFCVQNDIPLSFKELRFSRFVNSKTLVIDSQKLVTEVKNRSQKQNVNEEPLISSIQKGQNAGYDVWSWGAWA